MVAEVEQMRREREQALARRRATPEAAPGRVCMNCGEAALHTEGWFHDGPDHLRIVRCAACSLAQLDRHIQEQELSHLEDENPEYQHGSEEDVEASVQAHAFIVGLLERYVPKGRLLEIGCSHGYKLAAARRAGWEVQGIELSPLSCRFARERLGLDVFRGTLDRFVPREPFDAVLAWHVLEHVPRLDVFLGLVRALLRPGGHFFCQVPSFSQYQDMEPWSQHRECFNRVHYWYFEPRELGSALEAHGLRPVLLSDDPHLLHLTVAAERT